MAQWTSPQLASRGITHSIARYIVLVTMMCLTGTVSYAATEPLPPIIAPAPATPAPAPSTSITLPPSTFTPSAPLTGPISFTTPTTAMSTTPGTFSAGAPSLTTAPDSPCNYVTDKSNGGKGNTIANHQRQLDKKSQEAAVKEAAFAIDIPKHVKEIVTCLKDLMNVGLTIGITFGWPDLNAIFTSLINQACQMLMSYMDQLLNQLVANIKLPDAMADILGAAFPGMGISGGITGSLSARFVRGMDPKNSTVTISTPDGTQKYQPLSTQTAN